jgi:hypothetical protein
MAIVGFEVVGQETYTLRDLTDRFAGKVEPGKWLWYRTRFDTLWRTIKAEGKNAYGKLGGLPKQFPKIFEKLEEAKENEKKSKFIALLDVLAGIGWKLSNDGKDTAKWDTYKYILIDEWNKENIDGLLSMAEVKLETPPSITPTPTPTLPKEQEMKIFGIPATNVLIGAGVILAGLWIYNRFIKGR